MKPRPQTAKSQLKVLEAIYSATDCCNEVYEWAILHWSQARIADSMPLLATSLDNVCPVDGDGCSRDGRQEVRGYRLTNAGYEALTQAFPERFPNGYRRFYVHLTPATRAKKGQKQ